jgi:hypothetical protein
MAKIKVKTIKGEVEFDADDCERITFLVNGQQHEMKQPHVSDFLTNNDLSRKMIEQSMESTKNFEEDLRRLRNRQ